MLKKTAIVFAILLLISIYLSGCFTNKYRGDNPELYTLAIHNFLGSAGYASNGEIAEPPETGVLETDTYGRILFYYHEGIIAEGCGYGIMQKSQDGYVYFYEDDCIIVADDDWDGTGEVTHDDWFSEDELAAFKERNDWEKPIIEEKCTKEQIVTAKPKGKLSLKDDELVKIAVSYYVAYGTSTSVDKVRYEDYFITDDYGREMYLVRYKSGLKLAIVFGPDGSCDASTSVAEIVDMLDYRETIKELKVRSGWNTEYKAEQEST